MADEYDVRGRRWIDCIVRLGNGRAIGKARVNIFVVRAFAKMREALRGTPIRSLGALIKRSLPNVIRRRRIFLSRKGMRPVRLRVDCRDADLHLRNHRSRQTAPYLRG